MQFESQFLDPELRTLVDSVTRNNFQEVKDKLIDAMRDGKFFKDASKHITTISRITTPHKLQQIYYSYILAAEGKGVSK